MNAIRTILVIVDPTAEHQPAVEKAIALAEKFNARLELFICDTKAARNLRLAAHALKSPGTAFITDLKEFLERLAQPLRARGLDVTTETVTADPLHLALLERVKHTCADMVVKDTHHHTIAQRTFLTNTDWELIRGSPVPLLLTKEKPWTTSPTICAAVDPGHHDDKPMLLDRSILEEAAQFAQRLDGTLHLIHAYIPMAMVAAAAVPMPSMVVDVPSEALAIERQAKLQELTALASDYRVSPSNVYLEVGGAGDALCRVAHRVNADVLAMGAVSRSGLKRVLVGSTAEAVLQRIPCDLLIVKAPPSSRADG